MVAANQADFLGTGGTVDPFMGIAPNELTPEQRAVLQERLRQQKLADAANATSGNNVGYQRSLEHGDTTPTTPEEQAAYDAYAKQHHLGNYAFGLGHNLVRDPVTMGILAAPAAITGLGAAVGGAQALGFGLGEGSIAGGATGAPIQLANEATGLAQAGPGFSQEAANAYNAASAASQVPIVAGSGAGAAGAAGGAAGASGVGGAAGFASKYALPIGMALAPTAINQLFGGRTKDEKALIAEQEKIADEARVRQGQQQDQRMNSLAQQVMAFNPRNQMLAQMFGPQAAFTPDQMVQMTKGPEPPLDQNLLQYAGNDQATLKQKAEMIRRHNEWLQSSQQRADMVGSNWQAPGAGAAPMSLPTPQAARKY